MVRARLWLTLSAAILVGAVVSGQVEPPAATTTGLIPADNAPAQSGPKGQYRTLLRKFDLPADQARYGDFYDYGYWSGTQYAGQENLPAGYWVYLAPTWYIFKDAAAPAVAQTPRQWGPEQATGAPDTWPQSGDITTAWASATPDGQREWLELTYSEAVRPSAVLVYETYNPGAVDRVTTYDANGKEVELWSGSDPTPMGKDKGISVIPVHPDFDLTKVRIYLDSPRVPGWNEIDAVGLLDEQGTTHWAASATASSTYADVGRNGDATIYLNDRSDDRLLRLRESDVERLAEPGKHPAPAPDRDK